MRIRGTSRWSATVLALALAGGGVGCAPEAPHEAIEGAELSDDHGHDHVYALRTQEEIASELADSPAHRADAEIARLSYLYRSPSPLPIEISTSADGLTWSDWSEGVISEEASDEELGVWVADLDATDAGAMYWRVRSLAPELPTELAVDTRDADELAADLESEADDALDPDLEIEGEDLGVVGAEHTTFRRYRFDLGRVGRAWLWLLRSARRRGWGGTLYGPRTGLRTYAQQAALWNAYQRGTGAPAFPPWGPSRHLVRNVRRRGTWYQAVDTNDVRTLIRVARGLRVSLHTPYSYEPWHVEARRSFGAPRGWRP